MNYYEKELDRLERNFEFSLGIYENNVLNQRTLCVQMMEEVAKAYLPKNMPLLSQKRNRIYTKIQQTYLELRARGGQN